MFKIIAVCIVCLFVCLVAFQQIDPKIPANSNSSLVLNDENSVSVTIEGEVVVPGIYVVPLDSILQDVVTSAGGLLESADYSAINLSASCENQSYFYIPSISVYANDCVPTTVEKININTATVEQLATLTYVSMALGEKIIAYRQEHGDFQTIEEIMNVSGIGQATYERIRDYIKLK